MRERECVCVCVMHILFSLVGGGRDWVKRVNVVCERLEMIVHVLWYVYLSLTSIR